jgi:hypothetical protein
VPYPSKVPEIESRIQAMATNHPTICTRLECNQSTYEGGTATSPGRKVAYLRIGNGTGGGRPRILIVAGMHARELAPPDAVLTFAEKLLEAYKQGNPMVYKKFADPRPPNILYKEFKIAFAPDVKQIIERTELYILPLANPDGRAFVQSPGGFKMWRKNRRPAPPGTTCSSLPAGLTGDGVDLNRNFDVGWDFKNFYSTGFFNAVTANTVGLGVSDDPCNDRQLFHGPAASPRVREPEAQNIVDLITTNKINFYMDVHSAAGKVFFPWGMARNQEVDPGMTFENTALDKPSGSGRDADGAYKEWMPPGTEAAHQKLGDSITNDILDSTGYTATDTGAVAQEARKRSGYPAVQSLFGFPTPDFEPGGSDDFAFSQQIGANPGSPITAKALDPVFSFTFECGRPTDGGFQPLANTEYPKVEREVGRGLATYLSFAAGWKAPVPPPPPGPSPSPPPSSSPTPSSGCRNCFGRIASFDTPLQPLFQFVCDLRDQEIKATKFGRRFVHLAESVYYSFSPAVAAYLRRHPLARNWARWTVVAPAIHLIVSCARLLRGLQPRERRVRWLLASIAGAGLAAVGAAIVPFILLARALAAK